MFDPDADTSFTNQKDGGNYVKFYRQWMRNNFKSEHEGREVGEERDFILIISPGQSKTEVRREASDSDKSTYRNEWQAYLDGKENQQTGTPIELLPGIPAGMADALKAMYVMTIEQAAGLSDLAAQKIGIGTADVKRKAQAWLSGGNGELKTKLAQAEQTIAELRSALELLSKPKRKPRTVERVQ